MDGTELQQIRGRLALTQEELAKVLGVTGNTVARWERGEVRVVPAMEKAIKFHAGLGLDGAKLRRALAEFSDPASRDRMGEDARWQVVVAAFVWPELVPEGVSREVGRFVPEQMPEVIEGFHALMREDYGLDRSDTKDVLLLRGAITATKWDQLEAAAHLAYRMGLLKIPKGQTKYTLTRRDVQTLGRVVEAVHAVLDKAERQAPKLWEGKAKPLDVKAEVRRRVFAALRVDDRGPGWSRRLRGRELPLAGEPTKREATTRRSDDPEHLLDAVEEVRELAILLDEHRVPPREREVLGLLYEDHDVAEVAKRLGVTPTTVRVTRHHLRTRFVDLKKKFTRA